MKKTKRVKIVTGLKCNIQCIFCYYRNNLKAPNRSIEHIKKDLIYAKKNGIKEVDFSGGEPTLHSDLAGLIQTAKTLDMKKVSIISNGLKLADNNYLKSLKEAGLDEILFSVHGSCEKTHDSITKVPGSFRKINQALTNAATEGITVRTNTVVNKFNFKDLPATGSFLKKFDPLQVNFITINDWCFAKELADDLMLKYSEMAPMLKETCNLLNKHVKYINVRYIPFCFMKGFEHFVCNQSQVQYDAFEWLPRVRSRLEVQNSLLKHLKIIGYGFAVGGVYKKAFNKSWKDLVDECIIEALRKKFYVKDNRSCKTCKFEKICDGVENTYADTIGLEELSPEHGDKIVDPIFFRKTYS